MSTYANINTMIADGGRVVAGRWRSVYTDATSNCADGNHDKCMGWILPVGGARECSCPCHDDGRPDYATARAATVKKTNWWHRGDFVTIAGSDVPWWKITAVYTRWQTVEATGSNGRTIANVPFARLDLFRN
jgi:hypothetical protein